MDGEKILENNQAVKAQKKTNTFKEKLFRGVCIVALCTGMALSGASCSTLQVTPEVIQSISYQIDKMQDLRTDGEVWRDLMKQVTTASVQERKMLSDAFQILLQTESGNSLLRQVPSDMKFKVKDLKSENDGGFDVFQGEIVLNKRIFHQKNPDYIPVVLAHELGHMVQNKRKLCGFSNDKTSFSPFQAASMDKLNEAEMMAMTFDTIYQLREKVSSDFYEESFEQSGLYSFSLFSEYAALYETNKAKWQDKELSPSEAEKKARRETMGVFVMAALDNSLIYVLPVLEENRFEIWQLAISWQKSYDNQAVRLVQDMVSKKPDYLSEKGNSPLFEYMLSQHAEGLGLSADCLEEALYSNINLQKMTDSFTDILKKNTSQNKKSSSADLSAAEYFLLLSSGNCR
jgi:hypothetical protein